MLLFNYLYDEEYICILYSSSMWKPIVVLDYVILVQAILFSILFLFTKMTLAIIFFGPKPIY